MKPWFRFHTGVVDDPKVQMLSPEMFKHWVNVLCIAGKYDGELPAIAVTAFTLHMSEAKAAGILAKLHSLNLLDKTEKSFKPHNWDGRQYKLDKTDNTNADRQKRYRQRHSNANSNAENSVTAKRPDTENREQKEDRIGDARGSAFTDGSKALSSALWSALGISSPLEVPPELAGTDWRAVTWEHAGWTVDLIDAEARRVGPGKPLSYYEKCFATAFAKRQAPLPIVEVQQAETLTVTNGRTARIQEAKSLPAVARRLAESGVAFGERPTTPSVCDIASGADVRLLPQSGSERPGDLRSGNGGGPERISAGRD